MPRRRALTVPRPSERDGLRARIPSFDQSKRSLIGSAVAKSAGNVRQLLLPPSRVTRRATAKMPVRAAIPVAKRSGIEKRGSGAVLSLTCVDVTIYSRSMRREPG
jgi:hypothetical protein